MNRVFDELINSPTVECLVEVVVTLSSEGKPLPVNCDTNRVNILYSNCYGIRCVKCIQLLATKVFLRINPKNLFNTIEIH